MSNEAFAAFDLGAESGRAMLATLKDGRIELSEEHRFLNTPQRLPSGLHWNLLELWGNLVEGLKQCVKAANDKGVTLRSLGVDTWGVDCAMVGKSGQLLGLPFAYRDERNPPAMQWAFDKVGEKTIYDRTGIQFLPFNTLFQLCAQNASEPAVLQNAHRLLMTPDLLHYFFSGEMFNEATIASTGQAVDPNTGQWDTQLFEMLGLPTHFLGEIVPAGTRIGPVREAIATECGAQGVDVILPGSHDTASAVAAVPVDESAYPDGEWAYLSSGTWSLMGAELDAPVVSDATREAGFTNERGVDDKIRFLKNIAGLWLVQQCRADFAKQGQELDYETLTKLASEAEPFQTLVDPDHEPFASPGGMLEKVREFARATDQPVPETPGQFVRCCLETLAMAYRRTLNGLEEVLGRSFEVLHVVGGGGRNELLNQMTADAIGRTVIVGPYEATAVGNALTQAIGAGVVDDLQHLRRIVRDSFSPVTYEPGDADAFEAAYERYESLIEG